MQEKGNILCFFTAEYPYGNKSETFIETEIHYLAKSFEKVLIFPSVKNEFLRTLPSNVEVVDVCGNLVMTRKSKKRVLFVNVHMVLKILFSEIRDKGAKTVFKGKSILLDYLAQQIIVSDVLANFFKDDYSNKVFYDYWFCDKVLALSILKYKNGQIEFVSRGHRYDIYDDCWQTIGVPFRAWKMKQIRTLFLISDHGVNYLENKIPFSVKGKLSLSRLGVLKYQKNNLQHNNNLKLVVSCSSMLSFKNVSKIPEILKLIKAPIHWIHFGDGSERVKIELECVNLPSHITYELKGHLDNTEVLDYYQTHKIDLFLSLSQSEGLPVSMMEALSFNIPIVAVPVGGIPELVIDGLTGFNLPMEFNANQYAEIVANALNYSFNAGDMQRFFDQNFNADVNYANFIEQICGYKK